MSKENSKVIIDCNPEYNPQIERFRNKIYDIQYRKYRKFRYSGTEGVFPLGNDEDLPITHPVLFDKFCMCELLPPGYQENIVIYGEFVFNYAAYSTKITSPEIDFRSIQIPVCDIDIMYFDPETFNDYVKLIVARFGTNKDMISIYNEQLIVECKSGGSRFDIRITLARPPGSIRAIIESRDVFKHAYYLGLFYGNFTTRLYFNFVHGDDNRYPETLCNEFIHVDIYNASNKGIVTEFSTGLRGYTYKPNKIYKSGYGFLISPLTNLEKYKQEIRDSCYTRCQLSTITNLEPYIVKDPETRPSIFKMNLVPKNRNWTVRKYIKNPLDKSKIIVFKYRILDSGYLETKLLRKEKSRVEIKRKNINEYLDNVEQRFMKDSLLMSLE